MIVSISLHTINILYLKNKIYKKKFIPLWFKFQTVLHSSASLQTSTIKNNAVCFSIPTRGNRKVCVLTHNKKESM